MQPSQLDVADKMIASPAYHTQHRKEDEVPDHQRTFFASAGMEKEKFGQDLFLFGEKLKNKIQQAPFYWKGFGTLKYNATEILFEPDEIRIEALQPVPAQKVLRENVQHNMLVGDQEMTSQQVNEVLHKVETKRNWFIIAGWIVLTIAVIAVIVFLYLKNFQTTATGLQSPW